MKNSFPNRFQLIRVLKQQSATITLLATDHQLVGRTNVVVKMVRRGQFRNGPDSLARSFAWHRSIEYPHLVKILDAGLTPRGDLFYVREFFEATSAKFSRNPNFGHELIAAVSVLGLGSQIHGSIKPSNVFYADGIVKLADPMLVQSATPKIDEEYIRFTAPEVLSGSTPNSQSDIYSIGALLYRAFAGKDPFEDFDLNSLKAKYMWARTKSLGTVCYVFRAISDLVDRMLDKDPQNRPTLASLQEVFSNTTKVVRAPLVGRSTEMESARKWMQAAPVRGLKVLFVEGEAGVGKTRFIEELGMMASFQQMDYAVGQCTENGNLPFEPFMEALKVLLRQRAIRNAGTIEQEAGNFWPTICGRKDGEVQHEHGVPLQRAINDIIGLLRSLAQRTPVTLVIEGIDRADASSFRILEQLLLRSSEIPVNLILTRRVTSQPFKLMGLMAECLHDSVQLLHLDALDVASGSKLLSYLGASPPQWDRILKASSGNTLLIEEYGKDECLLDNCNPRIENMVLSSVDLLTPPAAELCDVLSILAKPTTKHVLRILLSQTEPEFETSLLELISTGLVAARETAVSFKNESFRGKIYSRLPRARRIRLHQLAFGLLQKHDPDPEQLAYHSYRGRLFEEAAIICVKVASHLCKHGNYGRAIDFFNQAQVSLTFSGRQLELVTQSDLAFCYIHVGKNAQANRIYRKLLRPGSGTSENRSLLSSIYASLAHPATKNSISDQARLCSLAIETSPKDSPKLGNLYAHLAQLLVQTGELTNASKACEFADDFWRKHPNESDLTARGARGYLLLHLGRFRESAEVFASVRTSNQNISGAVLTNVALCWEHLGDLRRAKEFQLKSQKAAGMIGTAQGRILSFVNLGAFERKRGNFTEAARFLSCAENLVSQLRAQDRSFRPPFVSALNVDRAQLQIDLGLYRKAANNLKARASFKKFGLEGGQLLITRCSLHLCYGDTDTVKTLLKSFDNSECFRTDFFRVERSLIERQLDVSPDETSLSGQLRALDLCRNLGTQYQSCEVLHGLALTFLALSRHGEARNRAEEALRTASTNEYGILVAKLHLARALACEDPVERQNGLLNALHRASEIGLREVVAEAAFHLGSQLYAEGHFVTAEEYLIRSASITRELAEEVPLRFRTKYLSQPWRAQAQTLLQECKKKTHLLLHPFEERPLKQDRNEFRRRALYRLTLTSTSVTKLEDFTACLLQALEASLERPTVLMLQDGDKTLWHSLRIKMGDDLRTRIRFLSRKSNNRIYFGNLDDPQSADTVAWIPLNSERHAGGFYVGCRGGESPFSEDEMEFLTILGSLANAALRQTDNVAIHPVLGADRTEFHGMIGASKAIREVYSHVEIAAGNAATVLIEGESGTGKELVAKAIHQAGPRAKEPFIAVDCGAIPEGLIEAELFGAKKGSYTGAVVDRPGLFEAAHRGTIFLDEISNTTPALQVKLLRVIQEREVRRIGETKGRTIDVRLIVASNANLEMLAQDGRFRKDLLYRLNVLHIKVPPLRSRRDDIPMLAHAFLGRLNAANKTKKYFAPGIVNHLSTRNFPGNVRELQNAIERAFFSARGTMINEVPLDEGADHVSSPDEIQAWFKELSEGRKDFWSAVHNRYKRRDISREKVVALVDLGLRTTRGSYKTMASMFHLKEREYRRFMDFLRRNECMLDFRPYRKAPVSPS